MFQVFDGNTADEAWQRIASAFRAQQGTLAQASRCGATREILHAAISISNPRQRWVVSRNPPMNIAFALAEVVWIMAGRNDSAFLNYFNRELPKYAGRGSTYHGAYGYRLCKHLKLDQLERAYQALSNNPDSRQVLLQIWDSTVDLPATDGRPLHEDIPCNIVSMLKVRGHSLEWTQIIRSNDFYRGLPYNFVQFTMMQEIVAGWLGLDVGSYNQLSDSLHVYESEMASVGSLGTMPAKENTDSLALPRAEFNSVLGKLEDLSKAIIDKRIAADTVMAEAEQCSLPTPYRNVLLVLSAEGVRRRKRPDLAARIMDRCSNPAYQQLYERWLSRFRGTV